MICTGHLSHAPTKPAPYQCAFTTEYDDTFHNNRFDYGSNRIPTFFVRRFCDNFSLSLTERRRYGGASLRELSVDSRTEQRHQEH